MSRPERASWLREVFSAADKTTVADDPYRLTHDGLPSKEDPWVKRGHGSDADPVPVVMSMDEIASRITKLTNHLVHWQGERAKIETAMIEIDTVLLELRTDLAARVMQCGVKAEVVSQ